MAKQDEQSIAETLEFTLSGPPTAQELAAASNTCRRLAFMLEKLEIDDPHAAYKRAEQAEYLRASSVFLSDWIRITAEVRKKHQS